MNGKRRWVVEVPDGAMGYREVYVDSEEEAMNYEDDLEAEARREREHLDGTYTAREEEEARNKLPKRRCPSCGTTETPMLDLVGFVDIKITCIRCGRSKTGQEDNLNGIIAEFYRPQRKKPEELPKCRCGSEAMGLFARISGTFEIQCIFCSASTPKYGTADEARACWRRMMGDTDESKD